MDEKAIKEYLYRRIIHANKRVYEIKTEHGDNPGKTHTYHGGRDAGLWEGMSLAYQNVLDEIEAQDE